MAIEIDYDRWAPNYDTDENRTRDLDREVLRKTLPDLTGKTVVEPGCGTGKNTAWLVRQAGGVIAFDFSTEMLRLARRKVNAGNVVFFRYDLACSWPLAAGSADLVTINLVLEHVRELTFVFAEAARVLRTPGMLFICELHPARQKAGSRARYRDAESGREKEITAYYHPQPAYFSAARRNGLRMRRCRNWFDPAAGGSLPRLISIEFIK